MRILIGIVLTFSVFSFSADAKTRMESARTLQATWLAAFGGWQEDRLARDTPFFPRFMTADEPSLELELRLVIVPDLRYVPDSFDSAQDQAFAEAFAARANSGQLQGFGVPGDPYEWVLGYLAEFEPSFRSIFRERLYRQLGSVDGVRAAPGEVLPIDPRPKFRFRSDQVNRALEELDASLEAFPSIPTNVEGLQIGVVPERYRFLLDLVEIDSRDSAPLGVSGLPRMSERVAFVSTEVAPWLSDRPNPKLLEAKGATGNPKALVVLGPPERMADVDQDLDEGVEAFTKAALKNKPTPFDRDKTVVFEINMIRRIPGKVRLTVHPVFDGIPLNQIYLGSDAVDQDFQTIDAEWASVSSEVRIPVGELDNVVANINEGMGVIVDGLSFRLEVQGPEGLYEVFRDVSFDVLKETQCDGMMPIRFSMSSLFGALRMPANSDVRFAIGSVGIAAFDPEPELIPSPQFR